MSQYTITTACHVWTALQQLEPAYNLVKLLHLQQDLQNNLWAIPLNNPTSTQIKAFFGANIAGVQLISPPHMLSVVKQYLLGMSYKQLTLKYLKS